VVFVADPNFGNILNFNIGSNLDLQVPTNFWTRLSSKKLWPSQRYFSALAHDQ
jgi:hypothetical protein